MTAEFKALQDGTVTLVVTACDPREEQLMTVFIAQTHMVRADAAVLNFGTRVQILARDRLTARQTEAVK